MTPRRHRPGTELACVRVLNKGWKCPYPLAFEKAMRRRKFIALVGGAASVWSFGALAQQIEQKRRIGVLNSLAETDVEPRAWDAAFRKRLNELGWIEGRDVQLDYRWAAGNVERLQEFAKELIRLKPDVLVSVSTPATAALQARVSSATHA